MDVEKFQNKISRPINSVKVGPDGDSFVIEFDNLSQMTVKLMAFKSAFAVKTEMAEQIASLDQQRAELLAVADRVKDATPPTDEKAVPNPVV
ncbi:MAG: hypothetical protein WC455_24385 [Dehalococcoidia bacterium]|jgi:hypothetical protein